MSQAQISEPLPGIEAGDGHHRIFNHGAHVCAWQPAGHPHPVLWVSSASPFADGKAIRGGIPICFPWFGPGMSGDRKPAHGFVRSTAWRRELISAEGDSLLVQYTIDQSITGEQPEFPYPYRAELTAEFAAEFLEVTLRATNTGDQPFIIEQALHTYLAVSDVRQVSIHGLDGATYLDKLADQSAFDAVQQGPLRLAGPTDRIFVHSGPVGVEDPGLGRRLELTTNGSAEVVVWNPWQDGAAGMADMGAGEWAQMVCVEAANVQADAITLLPGEDWTISQRIEVRELAT
jgi:glucose-6-phosphate 1-epimerase